MARLFGRKKLKICQKGMKSAAIRGTLKGHSP